MAAAAITSIDLPWPTPQEHVRGEKFRPMMFQMEVLMSAGTKQAKLALLPRFVPLHAFPLRSSMHLRHIMIKDLLNVRLKIMFQ